MGNLAEWKRWQIAWRKRLAHSNSICESAGMSAGTKCMLASFIVAGMTAIGAEIAPEKSPTMAEVLAASKPADWRSLDPENTVYLELTNGRVVIELASAFAPNHVANIKALVRERYFDGLAFLRCQDNYVVQWGDPDAERPDKKRKIQTA